MNEGDDIGTLCSSLDDCSINDDVLSAIFRRASSRIFFVMSLSDSFLRMVCLTVTRTFFFRRRGSQIFVTFFTMMLSRASFTAVRRGSSLKCPSFLYFHYSIGRSIRCGCDWCVVWLWRAPCFVVQYPLSPISKCEQH